MKNSNSPKKSNTIWVALIVMPFAILSLVAVLQIIVHFIINGSTGSDHGIFIALVNITSALLGIFGAISLIGLPVWIIMLLKNSRQTN